MDPLSVTASIVAIGQLTGKVGKYLGDAKDASTERSQFTTEISNLSNLLFRLLSYLNENSDEPWNVTVRELGGKDGLIYQYRVALEQLKGKIAKKRTIKNIAKTILWRHVKEDADRILLGIERLKSIVQIALEMDHLLLSKAIESRVVAVHKDAEVIKAGVDSLQHDQTRQKHNQVMAWISSDKFLAQQSDLISRRQEDTGLWFLNSPTFTEWKCGASPTLFCPGIPGAGKTIMAATTVDHLQNTVQAQDVGVAYIYCNYKERTDQTALSLLTAVLKQLVQDRPLIAKPLSSLYDRHVVRNTRPSLDEVTGALQPVLAHYSRVYVIIDALDECAQADCENLLDKLRDLQSKTDLRFMATSRFIPNIVEQFNGTPRLEVRADSADIERYVEGQTNRLRKCIQRDNELQKLVQSKIAEAVDGMFLLARLYVDSLLDVDTKKKVRSTLDGLRGGAEALDKAYDNAIERIEGQLAGTAARAKSVLSWISYAERQLTIDELCTALAVEPGDNELDDDNKPDIEELVSYCAGLVTVDEDSNVVRLVHYTTQEYLKKMREERLPIGQCEITSTCLTYLCFDIFTSGSCKTDAEFEDRLKRNPFLDYSARYWGYHAATVQEEVSELAIRLLRDENLVSCAVQTGQVDRHKTWSNYSDDFPREATGLHICAYFGLVSLSEKLLSWIAKEKSALADSRDSWDRTPLWWAAERGYESVVKLLAERDDVDLDPRDRWDDTPLSVAARHGHKEVVKLLAERDDVDNNPRNMCVQTPLFIAAKRGHREVVKLLAERNDVDINSRDEWDETPLSIAAERGHELMVKLLIERADIDINSRNDKEQTPLLLAAKEGHKEVVKLLAERPDVDINPKDNEGWTPLSIAVENGHEEVVELLKTYNAAM